MISVRLMTDGRLVRERGGVLETLVPRVDQACLDAITEAEIAAQEAEDNAEAWDAAAAYARPVRRRTGLTQAAFAPPDRRVPRLGPQLGAGQKRPGRPAPGTAPRPGSGTGCGAGGIRVTVCEVALG